MSLNAGATNFDTPEPLDFPQKNSREQAIQDATSPANFLMDSLKLCFNIRLPQVVSLLQQNNKQLILMCLRGMKDMGL